MSFDIKQRGKSWRARVRIYTGPTETATFDSHREAMEWAVITHGRLLAETKAKRAGAKKECQPDMSQPVAESPVSVEADPLISSILKMYAREVLPRKASHKQEIGRIKRLILYFWGRRLSGVTESLLDDYKVKRAGGLLGLGRGAGNGYCLKSKGKKKRLEHKLKQQEVKNLPSSQTVRHEIALLRRALKFWYKTKLKLKVERHLPVLLHPIFEVDLPDKAESRTRRFTDEELFALMENIGSPETRAAVAFAVCTSLRRSEIVSLRWEDVDFVRATIKLHKPGYLRRTKVKARDVPLIPRALEVLRMLGPKSTGVIWPISAASLTQAFGRAKLRAGLKDARLHDLRREAISRYVELYGLGIEMIKNFSGHRESRTLEEHYLKPQSHRIAAQVAQIENSKPEICFIPMKPVGTTG